MHPEAMGWVARFGTQAPVAVLDLGGRFVNGTPRPLFPGATCYTVVDILDGPGVDVVADAATWRPDRAYDVVLACELFEHAASWREVCRTAYLACRPGGRLVVTTAAPGREAHSGIDGGPVLHPGEWYANIDPAELRAALERAGFAEVVIDVQPSPADVRAVATRPIA